MADDFQVKQSSSSSGAYSLGGAVLGGFGAGVAANKFTKPKYGSYEDLIKEAKDSTDFSSKIDKAEGEEKDFLTQAKEIAGKEKTVGEQWDAELKEYLEKNKDGKPIEDDAYKALVEKQTAAEKALTDKRAALLAEEVEVASGSKPLSATHKKYYELQKARNERALADIQKKAAEYKTKAEALVEPIKKGMEPAIQAIYDARNMVDSLEEKYNNLQTAYAKEKDAAKKAKLKADVEACHNELKAARKAMDEVGQELEKASMTVAESFEYGGLKGDALKKAKEAKAKEIKTFVESSVNERILNNRVKADVVKGFVETKEKSFDVIKDIAKRDLSDKTPEEIGKRVQLHIDKVETPNLERLKKLQQAYKDAVAAAKATGATGTSTTVTTEFTGRIGKGKRNVKT